MLRRLTVMVFMLFLVVTPALKAQQGGLTTYVYDDDGRLIAVISPTGEASVYEYDAAGNFTAIRRLTPNDLTILAFTPGQGPIGMSVTIYGTGFNQGVSAVSFNGTAANITSSNGAAVVAVVPEGATTGSIAVVTPRGTVSTTTPFIVKGVLISPRSVTLPALDGAQFSAIVSGTPTGNVTWSVDEIVGGNSSVGTITSAGFYTAPNLTGSNPVQYILRATSVDDPELFDEAAATVIPFGTGYQFRSLGVSVRYGPPANSPPTFINGAVSVRYGTPANMPPTFVTGAVSASRGPVLDSLTPGTITRSTSVTLTIDGTALNGSSAISFFSQNNGSPSSGVTVSNISVNGSGTSLTATITVAGNAATGTYIVVVTTSSGSTVRNDVTTNRLQIN